MRVFGLLLLGSILLAQKPRQRLPESAAQKTANWILTFDDEFEGPELDLSKWVPHDPSGQPQDRQIQAFSPESARVGGGQLHLIAAHAGAAPTRLGGQDRGYVSGIVTTYGIFSQMYGRFEIRCRIPRGQGLRPSFFLLPVPSSNLPSIEVFEASGGDPSTIFAGNRWGTEQTLRSFGDSFTAPDLAAGFHTLAVEWERDGIAWFMDGKERFRSADGVPRLPMYLVIELGVGGTVNGIPGRFPDIYTRLPASFDIDYIRVYRRP